LSVLRYDGSSRPPGHRAARHVLGRPAGVTERLRGCGGTSAEVAAPRPSRPAGSRRDGRPAGPGMLIRRDRPASTRRLTDVQQNTSSPRAMRALTLRLHLGVGHGPTLRCGARCPGGPSAPVRWPHGAARKFLNDDESCWPNCAPLDFLFGPLFSFHRCGRPDRW